MTQVAEVSPIGCAVGPVRAGVGGVDPHSDEELAGRLLRFPKGDRFTPAPSA